MTKEDKSRKYMNPYLAGFLLGMVLLASFYFTGRGLGASGAMKSGVVSAVNLVAPALTQSSVFYSKYVEDGANPLNSWLVFEVVGVFIGAILSGILAGRMKAKTEHSPKITTRKRLIFAVIGGALFGIGAQLARGCTSGAALSGMAILSLAGFITMMSIFGTAFLFAYFFRKLWI